MISDRYFLTAGHIDATNGGTTQHTVNFFHDFADSIPDETALIDKDFGERVGGSDLWLGRFTSTPSPAVKRYPLIKRQEATYYPSYVDPKIYLVGYRGGENGASQTRVGLNDIVNVYGAKNQNLRMTLETRTKMVSPNTAATRQRIVVATHLARRLLQMLTGALRLPGSITLHNLA